MKIMRLSLTVLCLLLLFVACGSAPRLRGMDTQTYTNGAGYHLRLPAAWELQQEEEENTVFLAPEGGVSLTVFNELGGEAYYGLDEITQMVISQLPPEISGWQSQRVLKDTEEKYRQVFKGLDEDGSSVYLDITVLQPHPGIRYYLMFASGAADHNVQSALFGDIVDSFTLDEELPYLYGLMEERRT